MFNRKQLALEAVAKAITLRKRLGVSLEDSISSIDIAEKIGVEVRLVDLPSMEGMYVAGKTPQIFLSSLRPLGRRNFTCAHEIGHHKFQHGEQFDELIAEKSAQRKNNPEEFLADCFASFLLMPKGSVDSGMSRRNLTYQTLQPFQVYALASWLGVGYTTLVTHLRFGLHAILHDQTQHLLTTSPKDIRRKLMGRQLANHLHIADENWSGRAIDLEVDDHVLLPIGTKVEGVALRQIEGTQYGDLAIAVTPGIARVCNPSKSWAAYSRVSRRNYSGRSCFRFEEEVPE